MKVYVINILITSSEAWTEKLQVFVKLNKKDAIELMEAKANEIMTNYDATIRSQDAEYIILTSEAHDARFDLSITEKEAN